MHDPACQAAAQAAQARRYTSGALWSAGAWSAACTLALGALVAAGCVQSGRLVWRAPVAEIDYVPLPGTVNPPPGVVLRQPPPRPEGESDEEGGAPAL